MIGNKNKSETSYEPLVSILMNCHNGEEFLVEAIDSIYAQTYTNWEIIFWDNASTDKSSEIASSYDDRLKYFCNKEKLNLYAARNKALEKVTGELIAFLDCDDYWYPIKLAEQVPLFCDPEVGLVFSDSIVFNKRRKKKSFSIIPPKRGRCFKELMSNYFICLPTAVIKKDVLDTYMINFNPEMNILGDTDMFLKIAYFTKLEYTDNVTSEYRIHQDSLSLKGSNRLLEESEIMIKDLERRFPRFFNDNQDVILNMRNHIKYTYAKKMWLLGFSTKSRKTLRSCTKLSGSTIKMYLLTFTSPRLFVDYLF